MRYLTMTLVLLLSLNLCAQEDKLSEDKRKEFEAQKVAFFTQALDLTPGEATVFWPLYNEMMRKVRGQGDLLKKNAFRMRGDKDLSSQQAEELIKHSLDVEQNILNVKKEYYYKLLKVMPAQKVGRLDGVEHKFHRQLLEKMKRHKNIPRQKE